MRRAFCFSRSWVMYSEPWRVRSRPWSPGGYGRGPRGSRPLAPSKTVCPSRVGRADTPVRYNEPLSPLDPTPLLGAAAVVGDRGDVLDAGDLDTRGGEATNCGLTARTWTANQDVDATHAVLHGTLCALLGSH